LTKALAHLNEEFDKLEFQEKGALMKVFCSFIISTFLIYSVLTSSTLRAELKFQVIENQMIISGVIESNDGSYFENEVEKHPRVDTLVLMNMPGGKITSMHRIADAVIERSLNTVALGKCMSACAHIFLAGKERQFAAGYPLQYTSVAFHGMYASKGSLAGWGGPVPANWERYYIKRTNGKLPEAIILKWANLESSKGFAFFFHPKTPRFGAVSFMCDSPPLRKCPKLEKSALEYGILTSTELAAIKLIPFWEPERYRKTTTPISELLDLDFMTSGKRGVVNRSIKYRKLEPEKQRFGPRTVLVLDTRGGWMFRKARKSIEKAILDAKTNCEIKSSYDCHVIALDGKLTRNLQQLRDEEFKPQEGDFNRSKRVSNVAKKKKIITSNTVPNIATEKKPVKSAPSKIKSVTKTPASTDNIKARLLKLKELEDAGLISKEEAAKKRQSILDSL